MNKLHWMNTSELRQEARYTGAVLRFWRKTQRVDGYYFERSRRYLRHIQAEYRRKIGDRT